MYYQSINGQQEQHISMSNRGLAYGDGVFTTAKVLNGKVQFLSAHIERLIYSCQRLNITLPDMVKITEELKSIAQRFPKSVAKIIITAGDGGRGYSRQGCLESNVVITFHAFPEHYVNWQETGINLGLSTLKLGISPLTSGIKHLNRLEQVLIRQELDKRNEDDLLVLNCNDDIIEASAANVFWRKDETWYTPELSDSGVAGLMRAHILETLNKVNGQQPIIIKAKITLLENIEAMFLCNSVMGVIPVRQFDNKIISTALSHTIARVLQDVK
jgi:4-amino-4-deoxychorismate lyase